MCSIKVRKCEMFSCNPPPPPMHSPGRVKYILTDFVYLNIMLITAEQPTNAINCSPGVKINPFFGLNHYCLVLYKLCYSIYEKLTGYNAASCFHFQEGLVRQ